MANEITLRAELSYSKGGSSMSMESGTLTFDMSGSKHVHMLQTLTGDSQEALDIGDIGTCGYMIIRNKDATNFVEIRPASSGDDLIKLGPGQWAVFPLTTSTPYALADSGDCIVEYLLLEA